MKLSELVKEGTQQRPPRVILMGTAGIGKSTWGAGAPSPIFLQTEDGLSTIDVPHFPLAKTLDDVWSYMTALIKEDHEYKTIVIDTIDWFERLVWRKICVDHDVKAIDALPYGRGYSLAVTHFERLIAGLNKLRDDKGMLVILLGHTEVRPFNRPDGESYDRYQLRLHRHANAVITEYADAVLFANTKTYMGNDKKVINAEEERVVYTEARPAWGSVKNRYNLPPELPLDFKALLAAMKGEKNG